MGEGPDIGFLDDVLGLAVVAQDAAGEPVQPAIVGLDDGADCRLIAVAGTGDELVECRFCRFRCVCLAHGAIPVMVSGDWMQDVARGSRIFRRNDRRRLDPRQGLMGAEVRKRPAKAGRLVKAAFQSGTPG
jgi:hypothetical protein